MTEKPKSNWLIESLCFICLIAPLAYLAYIWDTLPQTVPIHFNISGEADNWADKKTLPIILGGLLSFIYFLFQIIPMVDPKGQMAKMGDKYHQFKLIMMIFMSCIAFLIIQSAADGQFKSDRLLLAGLGALFMVLGNFMQAVKPNYFLGIRTPWSLENADNWRLTHRFGARLWMLGGLVVIILAFILPLQLRVTIILSIIILISVIPLLYSWLIYNKMKQ